jgi:hypothetical protein
MLTKGFNALGAQDTGSDAEAGPRRRVRRAWTREQFRQLAYHSAVQYPDVEECQAADARMNRGQTQRREGEKP